MKKGTKVFIDWPRVYPQAKGTIVSKSGDMAKVFTMGGITEFPIDKLKRR
jgi:hypothetical protein